MLTIKCIGLLKIASDNICTFQGGWDKCLGPFNHYEAQRFGVDVWDCHSNCYVRKDPNGSKYMCTSINLLASKGTSSGIKVCVQK